jgi:pyruvate,water dikinase
MSDVLLLLGSGKLTAAGVAPKAARLDEAKGRGLPVPEGAVVLDGADAQVAAAELAAAYSTPLAVRSAFSAEDTAGSSMAGHFHTALDVQPDPAAIRTAIDDVRRSGDADIRRDVLVMPMIDARRAGVAFTEPGWQDDIVNVVSGQGEQLVSGAQTGDRIELPRIRRRERPTASTPWEARLQELLRDTRVEEGDEPWDIEWADDGTMCWFLQIRPITAPITRDETFTLANHREILPDPPSVFMSSIIMSNGRRLAGPGGLLAEATARRGYFEMFDGRPYINQSITSDLVRSLGLPSALVNASLGGDDVEGIPVQPLRLLLSLPQLLRLGADQSKAVRRSRRIADRLSRPTTGHSTFAQASAAFADDHLALVEEMGNLVSAMAVPLALLRRAGVLTAHFADLDTPGTRIMRDLRSFAELAAAEPVGRAALSEGQLPEDSVVADAWEEWLAAHGHRGRFESDVSQPRFSDSPEETLRLAASLGGAGSSSASGETSWRTTASLPLWWLGRRALVAREELRTRAMRGFHTHRKELLRLSGVAVSDGRLPEDAAVWDLSIEELTEVDSGRVLSPEDITARREAIAEYAAMDVPEVRNRFGAIESGGEPDGRGIPLHPGRVAGRAWVLDAPSLDRPEGFETESTVLIARSVDAGWVPTFGLVAGVAVDIGGDLSHGSIILRELGLPSITNTRGMTKKIETGDSVILDASNARVIVEAVD